MDNKTIYGVDYQTAGSEVWLTDGQTDKTFEDARSIALKHWRNGNKARVVAWTKEDGYFTVANYK